MSGGWGCYQGSEDGGGGKVEDETAGHPDLQRHKEVAGGNVRRTSSHLHRVSPVLRPLHLQAGI